jgi:hypothetical protein
MARPMMTTYRNRGAAAIENDSLRVTVLEEGGHIAEIFDKHAGVNPLWTPPWPSIEPSSFDRLRMSAQGELVERYGSGVDARLLAGIMGHNLCLDVFGEPSADEAAAGIDPHGEASVARYEIKTAANTLTMRARLPVAQILVERRIELRGRAVHIGEAIENLTGIDRPIGWTQHVTLGPPFLMKGVTEFRASASRSKVLETDFGVADYLRIGAEFDWPNAPRLDGRAEDLRRFTDAPASGAYTAHLMDPHHEHAFFVAFSPASKLAFGYVWNRNDFPWMGIWEENHSRVGPPWNGQTLTRGMEFGVSPFPESRRQMVERGSLFDTRTYRWLPAKARLEAEYWALTSGATRVPERLEWP